MFSKVVRVQQSGQMSLLFGKGLIGVFALGVGETEMETKASIKWMDFNISLV